MDNQKTHKHTGERKGNGVERLILIGGSAGGVKVVSKILGELDPDLRGAVLVVVHLSERVTGNLIDRLSEHSLLPVSFAHNGEAIENGKVYVAPPASHCLVEHKKFRLTKGPRVNRVRPSIDLTFRSAAVAFSSNAIGILVSGLLDDGVTGLQALKSCGGTTIIQSPDEAEYAELPTTALYRVKPRHVLLSGDIPALLKKQLVQPVVPLNAIPPEILLENQLDLTNSDDISAMNKLGNQIPVSCPDCGGPLWEVKDKEQRNSHYRCHVGHVLSQKTLLLGKDRNLEQALWVAYRNLEEKMRMLENMARHEKESSREALSALYTRRANETQVHVGKLKSLLHALNESILN